MVFLAKKAIYMVKYGHVATLKVPKKCPKFLVSRKVQEAPFVEIFSCCPQFHGCYPFMVIFSGCLQCHVSYPFVGRLHLLSNPVHVLGSYLVSFSKQYM